MTAFYMWRLMGKTFYGESRVDPHVEPHVHESPWTMTLPLILLAIPSALLGLAIGLPLGASTIAHWLEPVFIQSELYQHGEAAAYQLFGIDGYLILSSVVRGHPRPGRWASTCSASASAGSSRSASTRS